MPDTDISLPQTTLYCTTGGSNKEYRLFTQAHGDDTFTLYYANGPIGNVAPPKVKAGPAPLALVQKEFDKTVKSKLKGSPPYTEASHGVAYAVSDAAGELSGWTPQLLTELDDMSLVLDDPRWVLQEKKNGERRGVRILNGEIRCMNKKGRYVSGLPESWIPLLKRLPDDTLLDAEQVGDELFVFDATRIGGEDLTHRSFEYRSTALRSALSDAGSMFSLQQRVPVYFVHTEATPAGKREMLDVLRSGRGDKLSEGVVARHLQGRYTPGVGDGRSSECAKFKFYEFAHCIVVRKNAGSSVALGLYDDKGRMTEVGSVTIPPNQRMPTPGEVLKVRYMHMHEGGSLYGPPVSFGIASVPQQACTLEQVTRIKLKASAPAPVDDGDYDSEEPEVQVQRERMSG